jgi:hypothetical protein
MTPFLLPPSSLAFVWLTRMSLLGWLVQIETKAGHIIRPISEPLVKKQKQEEDQGEPVNRGAAAGNKRKRADTKNAKQTTKK